MNGFEDLFIRARQIHKDGDAAAAVPLYEELLAMGPHPHAPYLLGMALIQLDRPEKAVKPLLQVTLLRPGFLEGWMALGDAYLKTKQLPEAWKSYRSALRLDPQSLPACLKLCATLSIKEDWQRLQEFSDSMAEKFPDAPDLLRYRLQPRFADQRYVEAILLLVAFMETHPDEENVVRWFEELFGRIQRVGNDLLEPLKRVDSTTGRILYIRALMRAKEVEAANAEFARFEREENAAHRLNASNMGIIYKNEKLPAAAEPFLWKAFMERPNDYHFLNLVVDNLLALAKDGQPGKFAEARELVELWLDNEPENPHALAAMGGIYSAASRPELALPFQEKLLEINPDHPIRQSRLFVINYDERLTPEAVFEAHRAWGQDFESKKPESPIIFLDPERGTQVGAFALADSDVEISDSSAILQEIMGAEEAAGAEGADPVADPPTASVAAATASQAAPSEPLCSIEVLPVPNKRLRIGYLSPDLGYHPVGTFFIDILKAHDFENFEFFLYSNRYPDEGDDPRSQEFRKTVGEDRWRWTRGLDMADLLKQIRKDNIDILVEMAGHTAHNRLDVIAHRAAPVQVEWLGYPNTTGLTRMDWRFSDAVTEPEGIFDSLSTEKIYRLPNGFHVFHPSDETPEPSPAPCIRRGYVTFGTYNNMNKLGSQSIALWADLLKQVPKSRIIIKHGTLAVLDNQESLRSNFAMYGIQAWRVDLRTTTPGHRAHLDSYSEIDIALDPLFYNGTTTTCDAISVGVPVLTLPGRTHSARVTASLMHRIGMDHWVARDREHFLQIGRRAAQNFEMLDDIRKRVYANFHASPLRDGAGMARDLETAFKHMWTDLCRRSEKPSFVSLHQ